MYFIFTSAATKALPLLILTGSVHLLVATLLTIDTHNRHFKARVVGAKIHYFGVLSNLSYTELRKNPLVARYSLMSDTFGQDEVGAVVSDTVADFVGLPGVVDGS